MECFIILSSVNYFILAVDIDFKSISFYFLFSMANESFPKMILRERFIGISVGGGRLQLLNACPL